MTDISIIFVSWNCWAYLEDCLKTLLSQTSRCTTRIVVVDNGSTDGTPALLKARYPSVTVVENRENLGFAAANNQAMRIVRSRYVLLLNPDTVVKPGALDALVEFMDANPDAWVVGPMMMNADGTLQRTGVRFPNNWNIFSEALFLDRLVPSSRVFGRHKELYADPEAARQVDYVQGACLMVRSKVTEDLGGMDEQFFMYFEETDWCYRMKMAGGQVWYCPSAKVIHFGGGELAHYDERRLVHYHRGLLLFYKKYYSMRKRVVLRFILFLRTCIRICVWAAIAISATSRRQAAASSLRGYLRTLALVFRPVST